MFSFSILTRSKWGHTVIPHYSESQIFVQKFNFDKTPTFSRVFHPKCFWQFFTWNQSCQQLKSAKPQHFHKFFTLGKSKLNFWTENEDFEQWEFLKLIFGAKIQIFLFIRDLIRSEFMFHWKMKLWIEATMAWKGR